MIGVMISAQISNGELKLHFLIQWMNDVRDFVDIDPITPKVLILQSSSYIRRMLRAWLGMRGEL